MGDVPEPADIAAGSVPFERCLRAVAADAAASDWGTEPVHVASTAARLLGVVVRAACGTAAIAASLKIHERLATAWSLDGDGANLLRRALMLCADHELNASTYAARLVASTGASLGPCILAGMSALSGPRHGGMTERVRALEADPAVCSNPVCAFSERLAQGQTLPGFGHRLIPRVIPVAGHCCRSAHARPTDRQ